MESEKGVRITFTKNKNAPERKWERRFFGESGGRRVFTQPRAAANGSVASPLQSERPRLAIAELGSFGGGRALVMAAHIAGQLATWPTMGRMVAILRDGGLRVQVGRYSIRVEDCSHFVFQEYGGDLGEPSIDADADTVEEMIREGRQVSDALARADIRHRFEIYSDRNKLSGYLHHNWPLS